MSIQDDYFDVTAALDECDRPESESFERLWSWACQNENELEEAQKEIRRLETTIQTLRRLEQE